MAPSSLFLTAGAVALAAFTSSAGATTVATEYKIADTYQGQTFFDQFNFFDDVDPTHGFVDYKGKDAAKNSALVSVSTAGQAYIGVDYKTVLKDLNARGRPSVRLESKKIYNGGLFIADIAHMPGSTCGVWPAFWTAGKQDYPNNGEIDILENMNENKANLATLHTGPDCTLDASAQGGTLSTSHCSNHFSNGLTQWENQGCTVLPTDSQNNYGDGFNSVGGGIYAVEWTNAAIKIWNFPRTSTDGQNALSATPDPSKWRKATLSTAGSSCDIPKLFKNHNMILDTTFCGDWAGQDVFWEQTSCYKSDKVKYKSCAAYVAANPAAYKNAYWLINGIKVYQSVPKTVSSSSSTRRTSSTSSSVRTSSTSSSVRTSSTSSSVRTSTSSSARTSSTSSSVRTSTSSSARTSSTSSSVRTSTSSSAGTSSTSSSSVASAAPTCGPATWTYLGCYTDSVHMRSLPYGASLEGGSDANTNELCQATCEAAGYTLSGTEYSGECYCGNEVQNEGEPASDGEVGCDMPCFGDLDTVCGGRDRLSLYSFKEACTSSSTSSSPEVVSSTSSAQSSSTEISSTSTIAPETSSSSSEVSSKTEVSSTIESSSTESTTYILSSTSAPTTIGPSTTPILSASSAPYSNTSSSSPPTYPTLTSTIITTSVYTVTSCAPTVTSCTKGQVVTATITSFTTWCPGPTGTSAPVLSTSSAKPVELTTSAPVPTSSTKPAEFTTSTVYATTTLTITKCPPAVTLCPASSTVVVTSTYALYTTVCPVGPAPTEPAVPEFPFSSSVPAPPESTAPVVVVVTKPVVPLPVASVTPPFGLGNGTISAGPTGPGGPVPTATVPNTQVVPEQPSNTPVAPEQPSSTPVTPKQPETPVTPEQPSNTPVTPEQPSSTPVTPEQPETPTSPEEPTNTPISPVQPSKPAFTGAAGKLGASLSVLMAATAFVLLL